VSVCASILVHLIIIIIIYIYIYIYIYICTIADSETLQLINSASRTRGFTMCVPCVGRLEIYYMTTEKLIILHNDAY
jgi:hypothetical protein